ncbi:MAG: rhomboid family intramembrane serine protease [Lachnospiraceae bacterium]|jgi:Predicted membrane protein|nr:rhomboid family intramembrane serine protease [Lachnospiraceae bacterium]
MNFLNKMERKFGRFAIPNLTFWLIGAWVLGFIIRYTMPEAQMLLTLEPRLILQGQVWRLISWLLIPPSVNILFLIFFLSCYYFIGTSIEQAIGTFRYNVYLIGGLLCTAVGAFILYLIYYIVTRIPVTGIGYYFGSQYVTMSLFMAFAVIYPNAQFRLYFIIPFKAKWMGIVDAVWMAFMFIVSNWAGRVAIISSILNFLIFFFYTRNYRRISPKEIHRKQVYRQQMRQAQGVTKHKCAICGRTEKDGDNLQFRFCSKCEGNYEYCQDHLFTHQHIKRS